MARETKQQIIDRLQEELVVEREARKDVIEDKVHIQFKYDVLKHAVWCQHEHPYNIIGREKPEHKHSGTVARIGALLEIEKEKERLRELVDKAFDRCLPGHKHQLDHERKMSTRSRGGEIVKAQVLPR